MHHFSTPKGLEDVSKYPDLFDLLQTQNASRWTNENLKLLAGGNILRVLREVEKVRNSLFLLLWNHPQMNTLKKFLLCKTSAVRKLFYVVGKRFFVRERTYSRMDSI